MGIPPVSGPTHASPMGDSGAPSQTNFDGLVSSMDMEMQSLQGDPSNFLGSLMGTTTQFDGFLQTMQAFVKVGDPSADKTMSSIISDFNELNQEYQSNGNVDTKLLNSIGHAWSTLSTSLPNVTFSTEDFNKAVAGVIKDISALVPQMNSSPDAAWTAYGQISMLADCSCFSVPSSKANPDGIVPPELDAVFEDINTVCDYPPGRAAAVQVLEQTDLPALQALYPTN